MSRLAEEAGCLMEVVAIGLVVLGMFALSNLDKYGECRAAGLSVDVCLLDPPEPPEEGRQ